MKSAWTAALVGFAAVACSAGQLLAQAPEIRPGDERIDPDRIREHTATWRMIQFRNGQPTVVGALTRRVERVNHTADEPAFLVDWEFRDPNRSGLDIMYLDAASLAPFVRYLTNPRGMWSIFQTSERVTATLARRNQPTVEMDTTLAHPRFNNGMIDLVLASLPSEPSLRGRLPTLDTGQRSMAAAVGQSIGFRSAGTERLSVGDGSATSGSSSWEGEARRFELARPDGATQVVWVVSEAPHMVRRDFLDARGELFLRWELIEWER